MKLGERAICADAGEILAASYGTVRSIATRTPNALATARKVRPSGFCVVTYCEPTTPPAPTRFSTSTVIFHASPRCFATRRMMTSVPPPAVKGTTKRICAAGSPRLRQDRERRTPSCKKTAGAFFGSSGSPLNGT